MSDRDISTSERDRFQRVRPVALLALGALSTATTLEAWAASAQSDNYILSEGVPFTGNVGNNDGLVPNNSYVFAVDPYSPVLPGLDFRPDGSFSYTPGSGDKAVFFEYTLTGPDVQGGFGVVSLFVNSTTAAAKPDDITIYQDELALIPVLDNDLVPLPVDPATVSITSQVYPVNGSFQYPSPNYQSDANLPIAYKPNTGFVGTDSFIYALNTPDPNLPGNSISSYAAVTITVLPGTRPAAPLHPHPPRLRCRCRFRQFRAPIHR